MKAQIRDISRRKSDLLGTAHRLDLACRNAMTFSSLKEAIGVVAATLRERAQTLQETIEDIIDEAALAESSSKKKDKQHGTAIGEGDTGSARSGRPGRLRIHPD